MAHSVVTNDTLSRPHIDPHRRAWGILLLSFAVFCTICLVSGMGAAYFLFQSTVPLDSILQVGRGTGIVSRQAIGAGAERELGIGDILRTDPQSQSTIFIRDYQDGEHLVATITLRGNTTITIERATRPRFNWSTGDYNIDLVALTGRVDVFVVKELARKFNLNIITGKGDRVTLRGSGQYSINASDLQAQVVNRDGDALFIPVGSQIGHSVPTNGQGTVVYATDPSNVVLSGGPVNLLANSNFEDIYTPPDNTASSGAQVLEWACANTQNDLPRGSYQAELSDGRLVMRLLRDNDATSHGETRCLHYFGQNGQDLSAYNYLALRVTFKINYQSLNVCGIDGSECPFMLELDSSDDNGQGYRWLHGFYSAIDSQLSYPLQCNSCSQEHENIYQNSWYTYESDNLFTLIPPDKRPTKIINVQFYASGHEYDISVGEVALLASNSNP